MFLKSQLAFLMKTHVNHKQIRHVSLKRIGTWYSSLVKPKNAGPPYKHIVQIGDPILRSPADKVPADLIKSEEISLLIKLMKKVLKLHECVGLSAPQIGVPLQIFLMEFNEKHAKLYDEREFKNKEMSLQPQTVIINPEIKIIDYKKVVYSESCGSVKGLYADVPRFKSVLLKGLDESGKPIELTRSGWIARIIQHEMDHLNGILYTDIMERKSLTCGCWNVINERGGKVELPYGPV